MRTLSLIFWTLIAVVFVTMGLGNREVVRLELLPDVLSEVSGYERSINLPIFMIVLLAFAAGMLLGLVWEWIREIPERAEARATARELQRLRDEVTRLGGRPGERDDVVALLEVPAVTSSSGLPTRR